MRVLPSFLQFPGCALALACSLACPALGATEPASAADLAALPLDTLLDLPVTGASRFASRASGAAASVTVVSAEEIRALGYRTLAEVLASMRGVMVTTDRSYSYIGVRGFYVPGDYNTRVLLLIDGNRTNDTIYDQAYLGSEIPLDLAMVERVEFIPGQGSAVYGGNALFGVVNVVTRQPGAAGTSLASVSAGSFGARSLRLADSVQLPGGTALQWSISRAVMAGDTVPLPDGGSARHGDAEGRTTLFARVRQGDWRVTVLHALRNKGNPLYPDGVQGDPRTVNHDEQSLLDLSWVHATDDGDELTARGFAGRYRFEGRYAMDYPPVAVNQDIAMGRWWGLEGRWLSTRWQDHKLLVGAELQVSPLLLQRNADIDPPAAPLLDDRRSLQRHALFVEDQYTLARDWTLDTGLRWDQTSGSAREFSLRTGLIWRADDTLVAKLIHGTAYRAPNAFEAHYQVPGSGGYEINPKLTSEGVRGSELALDWRPDAQDRYSLSLFSNRARQLLVLNRDPDSDRYRFDNQGGVQTRGAELEWERIWANGGRLRANVTLQHSRDSDMDTRVAGYSADRMAKLAAIWPLGGRWQAGLGWQGIGRRGAAAAYQLTDLTLSTPLAARGWSFSASVFDLFDRRHQDPGGDPQAQPVLPQAGRSVELRLDFAF
ncbi:MAG TPA: TonB-dependent receptor [Ideonella sp.]|uniref:TonB-dependent receptor plug domain-containing protein n=1 Tax=Ideonella sp. TaxID=1929293 RepID=UPI002D048027|nr:TonB-dependent receptor [Ideonella sp.]HSI47464.1 TonB-dependent receptor [Ideonella sp.]